MSNNTSQSSKSFAIFGKTIETLMRNIAHVNSITVSPVFKEPNIGDTIKDIYGLTEQDVIQLLKYGSVDDMAELINDIRKDIEHSKIVSKHLDDKLLRLEQEIAVNKSKIDQMLDMHS